MYSEGIMFDWSGVWDVVKAQESCLRIYFFYDYDGNGAFFGDGIINRLVENSNQGGILISMDCLQQSFPYLIPSTLGFMLVGLGVSTIVPTLYSIAGTTIPLAKH
jgi:hypothetical protein